MSTTYYDPDGNGLNTTYGKGSETMDRLEYLRSQIRAERISWGEIAELQGLADEIDPSDVELLELAGVPEHRNGGADLSGLRPGVVVQVYGESRDIGYGTEDITGGYHWTGEIDPWGKLWFVSVQGHDSFLFPDEIHDWHPLYQDGPRCA